MNVEMGIRVLFIGVLADVTGSAFRYYTNVRSMDELKLMIENEFPELVHYLFRISHNRTFTDANPILRDGDEVALIPPFSGG